MTGSTPIKDPTGKDLEKLVASLERALAGTTGAVEAPSRRLVDRDTGLAREHDVLIAWDHGHHRLLTAIECRDRSRPVGVPEVEAFADKCQATGVSTGVIVATKGFYESARRKAEARSILCMEIETVNGFHWLGMTSFDGFERNFEHMDLQFNFVDQLPPDIASIFDTNGTEITRDQAVQTMAQALPPIENPDAVVGETSLIHFRANTVNWTVKDSTGRIWPVDHVLGDGRFIMKKTVNPLRTHIYRGGGRVYEVALAEVSIANHSGRIVMIRNEEQETTVYWVGEGTE